MSAALGHAVLAVRAEHCLLMRRAGEVEAGRGGAKELGGEAGGEDVAYLRGSSASTI